LFDITFVTVSLKEETFFHGRTRAPTHETFGKKKKKDIAFCQGVMAETRISAAYHNFSETSKIVLHKSKSRSGNFYDRNL